MKSDEHSIFRERGGIQGVDQNTRFHIRRAEPDYPRPLINKKIIQYLHCKFLIRLRKSYSCGGFRSTGQMYLCNGI